MDSKTLLSPIQTLSPRKPICVKIGQPVSEAIKTMRANRIGCVCVVDEHGALQGIITERDILKKVVGGDKKAHEIQVENVMTYSPEYLFLDDQIAFALNRMHLGGFRHIPLMDLEGHPTGIISVKDIVQHMVESAAS